MFVSNLSMQFCFPISWFGYRYLLCSPELLDDGRDVEAEHPTHHPQQEQRTTNFPRDQALPKGHAKATFRHSSVLPGLERYQCSVEDSIVGVHQQICKNDNLMIVFGLRQIASRNKRKWDGF